MAADHPITLLRAELAARFASDLPADVHPVEQWCAEPQFFPGATGLLTSRTWLEVVPGSSGVAVELPIPPERGVLVLGNYQASYASYRRILDGEIGGLPTTWRVLRQLLASTRPTEVFLTNAFIGLPDIDSDTAPFPTTPSFTRRCEELLATELSLLRPRLVVCLGVPAAKLLAAITPAAVNGDHGRATPASTAERPAGLTTARSPTWNSPPSPSDIPQPSSLVTIGSEMPS